MQKHILIAEDEANTRVSLNILLKRAGYKVTSTSDGISALDILTNPDNPDAYDLLLTDMQMPEMTGLELIRKIKERQLFLPVIVFTGFGDKDTVVELLREGCEDYLDKPFSEDDLLKKVKKVISNSDKKDEEESAKEVHMLNVQRKLDSYKGKFLTLCNSVNSAVSAYKEILGTTLISNNVVLKVKTVTMDKLGGDFAAVYDTPKGCDVMIADVAGHDMGASYHTIMLKTFFEENINAGNDGEAFFQILNKQLLNNGTNERLVTGLFLKINLQEMWIEATSAAHPYLLKFKDRKPNSILRPLSIQSGYLLGIKENATYEVRKFDINPGDRIILYTDGVTSATNINGPTGKKTKLGDMGLRELLKKNFWNSLDNMIENTWQDIMIFCKHKISDDMVLMGIEIPEYRNNQKDNNDVSNK